MTGHRCLLGLRADREVRRLRGPRRDRRPRRAVAAVLRAGARGQAPARVGGPRARARRRAGGSAWRPTRAPHHGLALRPQTAAGQAARRRPARGRHARAAPRRRPPRPAVADAAPDGPPPRPTQSRRPRAGTGAGAGLPDRRVPAATASAPAAGAAPTQTPRPTRRDRGRRARRPPARRRPPPQRAAAAEPAVRAARARPPRRRTVDPPPAPRRPRLRPTGPRSPAPPPARALPAARPAAAPGCRCAAAARRADRAAARGASLGVASAAPLLVVAAVGRRAHHADLGGDDAPAARPTRSRRPSPTRRPPSPAARDDAAASAPHRPRGHARSLVLNGTDGHRPRAPGRRPASGARATTTAVDERAGPHAHGDAHLLPRGAEAAAPRRRAARSRCPAAQSSRCDQNTRPLGGRRTPSSSSSSAQGRGADARAPMSIDGVLTSPATGRPTTTPAAASRATATRR